MRRIPLLLALIALAAGIAAAPRHLASRVTTGGDFVHFESGHVHPAAMTPDGTRLLVVNTPDNHLTVFSLVGGTPVKVAEVPVGMEPVSVAALDDGTAWVVNHLSDDVSVVDLTTLHVRATIRTGDEPQDVVFAGSPTRAYVSVSTEDVIKVYDPTTLAQTNTIPVNGRMPRALAKNAAGTLVFASIFHGGNRTSVLSAAEVAPGLGEDGDFSRVTSNKFGHPDYPGQPAPAPAVAAIIQYADGGPNGAGWYDEYGTYRSAAVPYTMYEVDVAEIETGTNTVSRNFGKMASTIFSVSANPVDGKLAVTGMEARNNFRYEPKIRGYLVETRLSFVSVGGTVTNRILNPHITYFDLNGFVINPGTQTERDSAISIPTGVAWSADGARVYVTAMGNDKLAVINPLAGGSVSQMLARVPTVAGPTGVVVDDARGLIYVVGRNRNELQTLSSDSLASVAITHIGYDPTPNEIVHGRRFFYGGFTSSHGDQSCATCHVFGDTDHLPWDLGDPSLPFEPPPAPNPLLLEGFDPEKGPMITQSLRGMTNTEPLHWRGDRTDITAFNGAFSSLLGRSVLPDSQITAFADFVMPITYGPNPNQFLNDSLRDAPPTAPSARRGRVFFMNAGVEGGSVKCVNCHSLPAGTNQIMTPDNALLADQDMKVPQLRNLYTKVGFVDAPGQVKRGTGFTHDGSVDRIFKFLQFPLFNFGPTSTADDVRRDVEAFLLAFDTGMSPAVGFQVTFDGTANPQGVQRVDTLKTVYTNNRCDIIAKGRVGSQPRGWVYLGGDLWDPDKLGEPDLTTSELLALATGPGSAVTVTGVPDGSGIRMGIDRDRDTFLDGDERDAGSNPGDPNSTPANVGVTREGQDGFAFERLKPSLTRGPTDVVFSLGRAGRVDIEVYDVMGRAARVLARGEHFAAGRQTVSWDGRRSDGSPAGAGVYFVRVRTDGGRWTRPLVMTR